MSHTPLREISRVQGIVRTENMYTVSFKECFLLEVHVTILDT